MDDMLKAFDVPNGSYTFLGNITPEVRQRYVDMQMPMVYYSRVAGFKKLGPAVDAGTHAYFRTVYDVLDVE